MGYKKKLLTLLFAGLAVSEFVYAECATNRNPEIGVSKPDVQYVDNGDGTVSDLVTGLTWQKCIHGQTYDELTGECSGTGLQLSWSNALIEAEGASLAGDNDWRLPNVKELYSLVEQACHTPSINESLFPGVVNHRFWSSTPTNNPPYSAYEIQFSTGYMNKLSRTIPLSVRLVRNTE